MTEEKQARGHTLQHKLTDDYQLMAQQSNLIFKVRENTEHNTELIGKLYDVQDQAKKDTEYVY